MSEPVGDYLAEYTSAQAAADYVIDKLPKILASPTDRIELATIIKNPAFNTALRYLMAPPISKDDLDTVMCRSVTGTAIRNDQDFADELVALLRQTIDPKRFPWLSNDAPPTDAELNIAKISSAVVATCQRVQTKRRGDEKAELEGAVVRLLDALGFVRIPTPRGSIKHAEDLPKAGEYMVGATLGNDNGDCIIGLYDRRRLALECKSSNSEINSRKRLNKEVIKDAKNWSAQFGAQVLTAAALRGVFKPEYVLDAQNTPIMIVWEHRLDDLEAFIESTKL
ncbi:XamI family restriction endonuclease [Pseudoduganella chitinolytica]|uniref:XamI family restriction endonuclease n=1 Tax=Pseudoduganella chitinolytica TaxID=34070 RepID=A0ABY8BCT9_9BURK|nr:XamI family restriction endonuclease [Pseudoduganella chitinolytica]WEF32818.1 XamI family restriction endonuclease [Pseudoduganella chitinolytica]